jgi:hypothetical protein
MKSIIITLVACFIIVFAQAQNLKSTDFKLIEGNWVGTLTYLDYTSNKPFTMPANTTYLQSSTNPNLFFRSIGYSTEPHANQKDTAMINANGKLLDDYTVTAITKPCDGCITIICEKQDVDGNDNKPAIIKKTISITTTTLTIKKEVLFNDAKEWLLRHTYSFERKH